MLGKDILRIVLYGIGLGSLASLIYFAGPLIAFGDWRPLENPIIRDVALVLLMAGAASFGSFTFYRRRKGAEKIADGIAGEGEPVNDEPVLKERMKDALATLKTASGGKSGYLYDLPWYVIIGPPGSGKTTALVNSGLKFPLSQGSTPSAVAGIGGTRFCDWWFTEEAVLIDTAGRYTTQDSDAKSDKQSWFSFLDLLKKNRPRQPINGVIVAISVEDLLTLPPAEITAHANAIRARLLDLHQRLKVDFPVYALFTKTDLVAGFTEYFSYLNEAGRRQVWGTTFQTANKKQNLVGEVPNQFDQLLEWLSEDAIDRLQEEPSPNYRVSLFGFPTQMARLKPAVFSFLNQIFEPTRYHVNATLRGFYFTSGTQQGTPIDQLIGSLARSFGAEQVA
ncbi:MAG: type VI secretion system membrane subunit TssM, partial [Terriglobia bacterium]